MNERKKWIDMLRALAMLMVIFQHIAEGAKGFAQVTTAVKLPLFFTISAYLFYAKDCPSFGKFLWSRVRRMLLPVFCLTMLRGFAQAALALLRHKAPLPAVADAAMSFVKGEAMWFVPCLFLMELLLFAQERLLGRLRTSENTKTAVRCGIALACAAVGKLLLRKEDPLPWHAAIALIMMFFALLGRGLLRFEARIARLKGWTVALLFAAYAALILLQMRMGAGFVNPNKDSFPCLPLNLLTGAVGITALFAAAPKLPAFEPLVYIGKNTFAYYAFHNLVADALIVLAGRLLHLKAGIIASLAVFAATLLLIVPIIWILDRFVPELIGKKRTRSAKA